MSQGLLDLPLTGVYGGLAAATDINAAVDALASKSSGASAPANAAGGVPPLGQDWVDSTGAQYKVWKVWDGTQWLLVGTIDATNHLFLPAFGGGSGSIASAATTDLGTVAESAITVTGASAIASFGSSAKVGWIKWLTFASSLTISNNAVIQNITNAAVVTIGGDVAAMLYLGSGIWKMVHYARANGLPLAGGAISSLDSLTHLGVNAVADATIKFRAKTNRALLEAVYAASGGDGDVFLRLLKELATDVAAIQLEQDVTTFGRFGLVGFNDFYLQMTPDNGANWLTALIADSADGAVSIPKLKYEDRKFLDKGAVAVGTVTFDRHAGLVQRLVVAGPLTIAFSNWAASGVAGAVRLELVNGGAAVVTWPAALRFVNADGTLTVAPPRALQAAGTDFVDVWSRDSGITIQAALVAASAAYAPLASPGFTGNPTAPTQAVGNNGTRLATTAFVQAAVAAVDASDVIPAARGSVGSYAFLCNQSANTWTGGGNLAGSDLEYVRISSTGVATTSGVSPAGTWRNVGHTVNPVVGGAFGCSMGLRVS